MAVATDHHEVPKRTIDWRAAVWAGVVASAVFIGLDAFLSFAFLTGNINERMRMLAAVVLGEDVLPPPASLEPGMLLTAVAVHMTVSVIYAIVIAWLVFRVGLLAAATIGLAFGLLIYVVNFYGFAQVFPWLVAARGPVTFSLHALYGLTTAFEYKALARRRRERAAA